MAVTMAVKVLEMDVQVLTKKSRIPVTIPVKKEAMLFHVSTKNVLMEVQTSFQLVPNHPSTTSAMPFRVFIILRNELTMKSQIDVKMPLMPFQHCSQSPVNRPISTSSCPIRTPVYPEKRLEIF